MDDFMNNISDQFPENDHFDPKVQFDSFLIGEGSNQIFIKEPSRNFFESFTDTDEFNVNIVNDLDQFSVTDSLVEDFEDFFFKTKKEFLDRFNFIEEKSKRLYGVPIRERDLVLSSEYGGVNITSNLQTENISIGNNLDIINDGGNIVFNITAGSNITFQFN